MTFRNLSEQDLAGKNIAPKTYRASASAMRLALHRLGRLAEVEAIAKSDPEAAILWTHSQSFSSDSALIAAMGQANGWEPEDIAALFQAAELIDGET